MRLSILLTLLFLFGVSLLPAQEIVEQSRTMSKGVNNGFYIEFPMAEKGDVEDLWKDYLKNYAKKVKKKKNEYYTEEGRVPLINGSAELTVYAVFDEGREMTTMYTWIDLGGVFLNTEDHPTQSEGLNQFLTDFYYMVEKDVIERELKDAEDVMKDLSKDLEKLVKKNEDYHEDIEKAQEKIREAELDIEKNLGEQDDKRMEIEKQRRMIDAIIDRLNKVGKKT